MENEDTNNIENNKLICDKCNQIFNNLNDIRFHSENNCRPSINSNNIYKFNSETFGINKYKKFQGGDIYILQTEFNLKGFYKIGVSTNLSKRLGQYRCGNVLEPKLHYYYPCKNIKETDRLLKAKLQKFNIKREIYKADNIDDLRNTIKEIQKESGSDVFEIIPENKYCEIIGCSHCNMFFTNKEDLINHSIKIHNLNKFTINKFEKIIDEILLKNFLKIGKNNLYKERKEYFINFFLSKRGRDYITKILYKIDNDKKFRSKLKDYSDKIKIEDADSEDSVIL